MAHSELRLARYEVMADLISIQGYSAWIQLTKSSWLTLSRGSDGRWLCAPDHPDRLVIAIAARHEAAFASDQSHPRASYSGCPSQRNARMLA